ncbi:MAG: hypothetical protein HY431_02960, partial [Candidatus Levybacteria bacterium]|nr:hypothetical protein [Candidatus Levybacteria bacterium]
MRIRTFLIFSAFFIFVALVFSPLAHACHCPENGNQPQDGVTQCGGGGGDPIGCQPAYGNYEYEYQYQGEYNYEYEYEGRYDYEYEYEYQSRYEYENQYSGEDSYDTEYPGERTYPAQESYNNQYTSQSNPCAPDAAPHSKPGHCPEDYQSQFTRDPLPRYDIEGTVYYDYDENKRQGPDEPGLRKMRVTAEGLSRGASRRDSDQTKANGTYRIRGLLEGRYNVEVDSDRNLPKDYKITEKPGNINLQNRDERRVDFGIFIPYTIKGVVFYDYNESGKQDKYEPGLGGQDSVRVTAERRQSKIDGSDDSKGRKGEYEIKNLPEGTYDVN